MFTDKNHKSILMRPLERLAGLPSPYNLWEGLGCLYRERYGPGRRGVRVPYLPKDCLVNEGISEELTVGFVGDILDTQGLPARVGDDVVDFFSNCDALVGNFESTITDLPGHGTSVRHDPRIIAALARLFPAEATYLSVANNHAGDFPPQVLFDSIRRLEEHGFTVFGWNERPHVDIGASLRVIGATDWSNAASDTVAMLEKQTIAPLKKPGAYNILFPHWGYELELYPRREMLRKAAAWSQGFEAVMAHHGHTPRAIYALDRAPGQPRPLIADSLGDFICGFSARWYHYGMVAKITLGKDAHGSRAVGRLAWEFCETFPRNNQVVTRLCAELPL